MYLATWVFLKMWILWMLSDWKKFVGSLESKDSKYEADG